MRLYKAEPIQVPPSPMLGESWKSFQGQNLGIIRMKNIRCIVPKIVNYTFICKSKIETDAWFNHEIRFLKLKES